MLEKNKQNQNVDGEGQAVQAGRDVNISQGMSLAQMAEVLKELEALTEKYTSAAIEKVDARHREFRESILARFADTSDTNSSAFADPDFQATLVDAQKAYARSGDKAVRDTLVDIIARRSNAEGASRLALTLNDAAARAPRLTRAEFSILTLVYLLRYTVTSADIPSKFSKYLNNQIMPLVDDVPEGVSAIWHIESQSCGKTSVMSADLRSILIGNYGGILGKGLPLPALLESVSLDHKQAAESSLLQPFRIWPNFQPNALSLEVYKETFKSADISVAELESIWNSYISSVPQGDELVSMLQETVPGIEKLFHVWDLRGLKSLELNSVGIAIGHANAMRTADFNAPLDIWIN